MMFCRFCADEKSLEKLTNLLEDQEKCEDVGNKLVFLNASFVDISAHNSLPKTICFVCSDLLDKAYDFLQRVKEAQLRLQCISAGKSDLKLEVGETTENIKTQDETQLSSNFKLEEEESQYKKDEISSDDDFVCNFRNNDTFETTIKEEPVKKRRKISRGKRKRLVNSCMLNLDSSLDEKLSKKESKDSILYWSDYPWLCAYCDIKFSSIANLRSHSIEAHNTCYSFKCIDCNLKQNNIYDFLHHVRCHRDCLSCICHICDTKLSHTDDLFKHLDIHFSKSRMCYKCGEIFQNIKDKEKHEQQSYVLTPKSRSKRKPVKQKSVERKPVKRKSAEQKPVKQNSDKQKPVEQTPIEPKPTKEDLACKQCNKQYKNIQQLQKHLVTSKVHTNAQTNERERNHICDQCGKAFYDKGTLVQHYRNIHVDETEARKHKCEICNYRFKTAGQLKSHVGLHGNVVKPFKCDTCKKCFRLKVHLQKHLLTHSDVLPHTCEYCGKSFRWKGSLIEHIRYHTGVKNYTCVQCDWHFTDWRNYNSHMKARHGIDTSKKKYTPNGMFKVNPETGQLIEFQVSPEKEEWKKKVLKLGRKKQFLFDEQNEIPSEKKTD